MNIVLSLLVTLSFGLSTQSHELSLSQKKLVEKNLETVKKWALDPEIVKAVRSANSSGGLKEMNQEKWANAPILDPTIRNFTKNKAAETMKKMKSDFVSEMFLNSADGQKVAFLAKTSHWSHKGHPKHDVPMTGKLWIGQIEIDDSTGTQQVQVGVPVRETDTVIGSLIVGFALAKLK